MRRLATIRISLSLYAGAALMLGQHESTAANAPAAPPAQITADAFYMAPPSTPAMTRSPEELPYTAINRMLAPLPADAPKASTNPRDLEGTWIHREAYTPRIKRTLTGAPLPLTQASADILTTRINADNGGKPLVNASTSCRPPGQPKELNLNFPFSILQTRDMIFVVFEEFHSIWKIDLKKKDHAGAPREYSGHSIGHWDGDTLVVETTQYRQPLWLDAAGTPVSTDGRLIHRIRKEADSQGLEIITTVDDPAMYSEPWSFVRRMMWRPDKMIHAEYNCEEQVGGADGQQRYGIGDSAQRAAP